MNSEHDVILYYVIFVLARRPGKVSLVCCTAVSKAIIPANTTITAYKRQNDLKPCVEAVM